MKLNRSFIGINYFLNHQVQRLVIEQLMDPQLLNPIRDLANWTQADLDNRLERLENLHLNRNHRLFLLTKSVQDHSELLRFEKIKLAWFRNVKSQSSTYIISKTEFFRFVVNQGKEIYVLHFYRDPNISDEIFDTIKNSDYPNAEFYGYKFDTFIIYIDESKYPDGFMPDNTIWGQDPINRERFLKLMLFIELSDPEVYLVKNNGKVKLGDSVRHHDESKIKNESGIDVTLVNTLWNKIVVRESGFSVKGHIRIQPYGPGREHYKPIWIDEFQKKGYIRGLDRDKTSQDA